ncbi:MAG: threonine synthase [Burkholderiaceae bacterium]
MNYISTRGGAFEGDAGFLDILLEGLAPDSGLAMPAHYPRVDRDTLDTWRFLSYPELAFEVLRLFATDIPLIDLRTIVLKTYTPEIFGSREITPLTSLDAYAPGLRLLGLSNGPTLAFKDMAMQLLGNLFAYALEKTGRHLNIVGATSGDTGSAAEYAMRGKPGIRVFMLSPKGRMSPFQTAQMFSLTDPNIHNIAVDGVFDDCQDIVKAISADAPFKSRHAIGTVNSINWARVVAQVVYYFRGYFMATGSNDETVSFTVPSGNFGNICAGHIARMMGLPIDRLVCATNENDVLDEFFRTGVYRVRGAAETHATSSPSMDISKASNFERFVFDLVDRDADALKALWQQVDGEGHFDLSSSPLFAAVSARFGFASGQCSHAERVETIRELQAKTGIVVDPHTAVAVRVARDHAKAGVPMIVLETAQPAKFAETIHEALGIDPAMPAGFEDLLQRPLRSIELPADVDAVKRFVAAADQPTV